MRWLCVKALLVTVGGESGEQYGKQTNQEARQKVGLPQRSVGSCKRRAKSGDPRENSGSLGGEGRDARYAWLSRGGTSGLGQSVGRIRRGTGASNSGKSDQGAYAEGAITWPHRGGAS